MNFIIGEIVKAQGIKGEVKVKPLTDDLARFGRLQTVSVEGCPFKLRNANARGGFVYITFEGVNTRNDAEVLVGRRISIDRSQAKKLESGEFFIVDLLGSDVYLSDETYLGKLDYIDNFGSADVFTVKGEKTVRFPFLKKLDLRFESAEKRIILDAKTFGEVCCYED
ncbi:MAG: 16S rRNA processing protein RimM [Clostridia bacterium]|nr:16S rRNA processing protein RimM [Clostridia bacterium]